MNACALGVFFFLIFLKRTIPYRARALVCYRYVGVCRCLGVDNKHSSRFFCVHKRRAMFPVIVNH